MEVTTSDVNTGRKELTIQLIANPTVPFTRADYFQVALLNNSIIAIIGYQLDYHEAATKVSVDSAGAPTVNAPQVFRAMTDLEGLGRLREQINQIYEQVSK